MKKRSGPSRALTLLGVTLSAGLIAGCGFSSENTESGGRTLNLYAANEVGFPEAVAHCNEQAQGRYTINYVRLPRTADAQRELMARRLAAEDSDIDLAAIDIPWTAEFAEAGWIREWEGERGQRALEGRLDGPVRTVQYQDSIWAAPFTTNTQILWYRKDRVQEPPQTWDELIDMAEQLPEGQRGIAVQSARYEGLTTWVNSLIASAGGQIADEEGNSTLDETAVRAAEIVKRLATSTAAPPGMANLEEDTSNQTFQSGAASFMVNYTFIYPAAAEIEGLQENIGWARWPRVDPNEPSHVSLGGFNLAVGAFSENPELAYEAAECLASPDNQRTITSMGGLAPTTEALYEDAEVKKALPFAALMRETLDDGAPRPVSPAYADITLAIQDTFHPPADIDTGNVLDQLKDKIDKAGDGKIF